MQISVFGYRQPHRNDVPAFRYAFIAARVDLMSQVRNKEKVSAL